MSYSTYKIVTKFDVFFLRLDPHDDQNIYTSCADGPEEGGWSPTPFVTAYIPAPGDEIMAAAMIVKYWGRDYFSDGSAAVEAAIEEKGELAYCRSLILSVTPVTD